MKKRGIHYIGLLLSGLIVMLAMAACTSSATTIPTSTPTSSPTPTPTATPTLTPTPTPTPTPTQTGQTFQMLATSGQSIYASTCAVCHGANGGGTDICPVVMWGTGATLGTYNGVTLFTDAQGMFSYMSKSMPLTAPGSLSNQQYIDLLAYILVQGKLVSPSTVFDQSKLNSIPIE